ncbi:MAG: helix-turn-helix domain-containing protein [Chloroflexi bacterium]|nr:helix-turn-helix domain-containing protein [Chloroflexota bacterium]
MRNQIKLDSPQYASLGKACQMLQVNEVTLRRWADRGLIRSFRTPGGHRRFALEDLHALTEKAQSTPASGPTSGSLADAALRHIRRRLNQRTVAQQPWYEHIPDSDRTRLRLFGYRLLALASDFVTGHGRRQQLLTEARSIGEEYGAEASRLGLPVEHATQAFAFFRNGLVEGLQEAASHEDTPADVYRTWRHVNTITDEVFQGITRSYDRRFAARKLPPP